MNIIGKTDVGKVRTANQDAFKIGKLSGGAVFAIVCDGMGGANGGNVASENAVKIISEYIESSFREGMNSNSVKTLMQSALLGANVRLNDMSKTIESLSGMGTTAVLTIVMDGIAHIAHVGDSRAYILHAKKISQITKDHSVVQTMVDRGQITMEEARNHPNKNVITRAIGVKSDIETDYNEIVLTSGDQLLLCTDGLTNFVTDKEIQKVLLQSPKNALDKLITMANDAGGADNITAVIIS